MAADPHRDLEQRLREILPPGTLVDVDHWFGCDEPWGDPVYVTGTDPHGRPLTDAVADLAAASLDEQAAFVAEQLSA
jgi:hypothetical protein